LEAFAPRRLVISPDLFKKKNRFILMIFSFFFQVIFSHTKVIFSPTRVIFPMKK